MDWQFVGLVTLYFWPVVVPSRPCERRKEDQIAYRCFNNETSMRHCLKLLGI